ncbi:MAG: hypothetical protein ACI4O7_07060 [Aristaeellaceae bacterium]
MTIRRLLRAALAILLCLGLSGSALAEAQLLPGLAEAYPQREPLEIELHVTLQTHMPFDETRTAQLNAMLSHLGLRLKYQAAEGSLWSRLAVLTDGVEVMSVSTRQDARAQQAQFSFLPDRTYAWASGSGVSLQSLLGGDSDTELWGLEELDGAWLEDALTLFNALPGVMADSMKTSSISTSITGMGKAVEKQVLTVSSGSVEGLGLQLTGCVPQGQLQTLLGSLIFSGKQTVTMWRGSNGELLRVDYAGNAGISQEDLRSVTLTWRLRRDDGQVLDDLTLRTPRVKGSGRNNVVLTRTLTEGENAARLELSVRYEVLAEGVKTVLTGQADLTRDNEEEGERMTGEVTLKRQQGDDSAVTLTLLPDLTFMAAGEELASGTVQLTQAVDASVKEAAELRLAVRRSDWMSWELRSNVITVAMENVESISRRIMQGATVELVRRLVLLPQEDTAFLSAGLEPDVWQQIVDAAKSALQ